MGGNTFAQNQTANQVKLRMHETQICQRCQRQVPCKSEKGSSSCLTLKFCSF